MEGDDVELAYKRNTKKTKCIWFSLILLALLLFAIGIIVGFYIGKAKSDKHDEREPIQTEAQREEQRQRLRDSVSIENLEENLRLVLKLSFTCCSSRAVKLCEAVVKYAIMDIEIA